MNTLDPKDYRHAGLIESLRKFAIKLGYDKPIAVEEIRAIRRVQIIKTLGYPVTAETIERELKLTRDTNMREAVTQ